MIKSHVIPLLLYWCSRQVTLKNVASLARMRVKIVSVHFLMKPSEIQKLRVLLELLSSIYIQNCPALLL